MLGFLSNKWVRIERVTAAALAAAVTGLILLNVITRAFSTSIFWIDEAAIYAMIWMTFLAASAMIAQRDSIAVTFVPDLCSIPVQRRITIVVDIIVLAFGVLMVWVCWRWFNPAAFIAASGDIAAFQSNTFNFIYSEPTMTLGIKKAPIWTIMAVFACSVILHGLANLIHSIFTPHIEPAK